MNTYISLLRGVNVTGHNRVTMEELRRCYEGRGLKNVRTFIQSGNVIFEHPKEDSERIVAKIEKAIRKSFRLEVTVVVRTREEMGKVIENFPFTKTEQDRAHVTFLSAKPAIVPTREITEVKDGPEKFSVLGREVYLHCPNGYGRSKLSNTFFERKLKVSATTRNWRTINSLYALASRNLPAEGN
jgi:uncharacterized protein (DUF1697 family)